MQVLKSVTCASVGQHVVLRNYCKQIVGIIPQVSTYLTASHQSSHLMLCEETPTGPQRGPVDFSADDILVILNKR